MVILTGLEGAGARTKFPKLLRAPLLISAEPLTVWGQDVHYHLPGYFPTETTWEFYQDTERPLVVG